LNVGVVFKDDSRALVLEKFFGSGGGLDDRTIGGKVATENGGSALLGEWFIEGEDDVIVINFGAVETFAEGLSEDRGDVEMEKVSDAVEEAREAAGVEEVGHNVFAGRSKIGEDGSLARNLVEELKRKIDARAFCESGDVDDGVGGTADGHVSGDGVFEGLAREVERGLEVLPDHVNDAESTSGGHA